MIKRKSQQEIQSSAPKKKMKHNYTSELELKSLLIRIKNKRLNIGVPRHNTRINKYIIWHTAINAKKYEKPQKRNLLKAKIKLKIVQLSEETSVDAKSYERFGVIVLLMIKNILRKPQFSGYTYKDDFYSDAIYKILKYLNNFNHKLISKITNAPVNAFAYISQIMHNSILYIINTKKKETDRLRTYITQEQIANNIQTTDIGWGIGKEPCTGSGEVTITRMFSIAELAPDTLLDKIEEIVNENADAHKFEINYPEDYEVSFYEFNRIKELSKDNIKLQREENV